MQNKKNKGWRVAQKKFNKSETTLEKIYLMFEYYLVNLHNFHRLY